jgi:hypothetical protein
MYDLLPRAIILRTVARARKHYPSQDEAGMIVFLRGYSCLTQMLTGMLARMLMGNTSCRS